MPHIIGTFYSNKMNRSIEYESINEFILYTILELDRKTFRYYVQPIEMRIVDNNRLKGTQYWFPIHCSGFANNIKITDSNRMGVIIDEPIFFHLIEFTGKRSPLNT